MLYGVPDRNRVFGEGKPVTTTTTTYYCRPFYVGETWPLQREREREREDL